MTVKLHPIITAVEDHPGESSCVTKEGDCIGNVPRKLHEINGDEFEALRSQVDRLSRIICSLVFDTGGPKCD